MIQNIRFSSPKCRQREPDQTRQNNILGHLFIYSGKLSKNTYLWVAKVCEVLGLEVNLKVKLGSTCSEMFSANGMTFSCQWVSRYCCTRRSKQILSILQSIYYRLICLIGFSFGLFPPSGTVQFSAIRDGKKKKKWYKFGILVRFTTSGNGNGNNCIPYCNTVYF